MLLTHTTWLPKYFEGKAAVTAKAESPPPAVEAPVKK
jgi:hypothetical protein